MAVLSAGMAIQAAESPETGLLKGRILDDEKNPLPGAVVILDDNSRSAITDVDGFYSFSELTAGNHRVKVTYIGYLPSDKVVSLTDGSTTQNFVMSD